VPAQRGPLELRWLGGWLKREFYPTLKRARVTHFRFHDLSHFAVSQLIAQGANILELARVAGHADRASRCASTPI
jgi:integrase